MSRRSCWSGGEIRCACGYEGALKRFRVGDGRIEEDCPNCESYAPAPEEPELEEAE